MTVYERYSSFFPGWTYPLVIIWFYITALVKPGLGLKAEELIDLVMTQMGPEFRRQGSDCNW